MPGVIGGNLTGEELSTAIELLESEEWYVTERFETAETGLALVHHGEKDSGGHATWEGDGASGVLYGTVSNRSRLGLSLSEVFEGLLDRPTVLLPKLSGPFLLAVASTDGDLLVATDKLSARPCYHAETPEGVVFSSELKAIVPSLERRTVDPRTVSDILSFKMVFGEKTLLEEVRALSPATVLRWHDGELSTARYWSPTFARHAEEGYVDSVVDAYRESMHDVASTVEGRVGLWLSGGLDSRTMAAVLREEHGPFRTFTYDSNPPNASNLDPARRVAETLGVDNDRVVESADDIVQGYERSVRICDGMAPAQSLIAPGFVFDDLHGEVDVMFEAAPQGELFGEHVWARHLDASSAVDAFAASLAYDRVPAERVRTVLTGDVDPDRSIRAAVAESDKTSVANRTMDVWLRNVPPNHFRGQKRVRSQTGTRTPFTDGTLLDAVAGMPHDRFRRDTLPFTGGRIPRSMSALKREVTLHLDSGIEDVPYERTGLAPSRPLPLHDAAYVAKQLRWHLLTGRPRQLSDWVREHDAARNQTERWLTAARDRSLFDGDAIETLREEHFSGEANHFGLLSSIVDVEVWLEQTLD